MTTINLTDEMAEVLSRILRDQERVLVEFKTRASGPEVQLETGQRLAAIQSVLAQLGEQA